MKRSIILITSISIAIAVSAFIYIYYQSGKLQKEIRGGSSPFIEMQRSHAIYQKFTGAYPYKLKKEISDTLLLGYAEQCLTKANQYFSLLNQEEDAREGKSFISSFEDNSIVLKAFFKKPQNFPAYVFDAKEVRKMIRAKYDLEKKDQRELEKANGRIARDPLDLAAYEEKERILFRDAIYEDGNWDSVVEIMGKQIEILSANKNKIEMLNFKTSSLLDLLTCLGREAEFSHLVKKVDSEEIAKCLADPKHQIMKDPKTKSYLCRNLGIKT